MNKKIEEFETKIELLNSEILELTRAKTVKIPTAPFIGEEEYSDKNKYFKNKERKDSDKINILGINTNNTSSTTNNMEKKSEEEKENINNNTKETEKEKELTPENYDLIKVIKLKNNLKCTM